MPKTAECFSVAYNILVFIKNPFIIKVVKWMDIQRTPLNCTNETSPWVKGEGFADMCLNYKYT